MANVVKPVVVKYCNETGDHYITSDIFEELGWQQGDIITWTELEDGSWSLSRIEEKDKK